VGACLDALADLSPTPDIIAASGSLPPGVSADFMGRLADRARELDAKLVVDTSGKALRAAAEHGVYLLKPNMRELRELTESSVETETEQEDAMKDLVQQGACEVAILSLGAAGVLLTTAEHQQRLRAPTVPIASRVGAGDSMVAGILVGLTRGKSVRDSVMLGVAAGSAAVMTPGTELCRPDDVKRLYGQMKNETQSD
jgi:6-phosphofructokinase 2